MVTNFQWEEGGTNLDFGYLQRNHFLLFTNREQKNVLKSPGPAVYPRDADTTININSLFPIDKKDKFTMPSKKYVI